jgi:hypothetical protein
MAADGGFRHVSLIVFPWTVPSTASAVSVPILTRDSSETVYGLINPLWKYPLLYCIQYSDVSVPILTRDSSETVDGLINPLG